MTATPEVRYAGVVAGKHVYEFKVTMDIKSATITRDDAYNVRIDVFMDNPFCDGPVPAGEDAYLMANLVRIHTSAGLRPRLDFAVMNPIRIEYLHPQFIGDEMVIHTAMNSPWGNYDVAEDAGTYATPGGLTVSVVGPTAAASLERVAFVQRHHDHFHHQEPVDVTWVWPYRLDGAQDGLYTVRLEVKNDQEQATAFGVATFEIGSGRIVGCGDGEVTQSSGACSTEVQVDGQGGGKDSPGIGALAILAGLGAATVLLRRR
jgi:hypothetical protein